MRGGRQTPRAVALYRVCCKATEGLQTTQNSTELNVHEENWSQTHKRKAACSLPEMKKKKKPTTKCYGALQLIILDRTRDCRLNISTD